jgi:superfamily II DNA helicase RecQ
LEVLSIPNQRPVLHYFSTNPLFSNKNNIMDDEFGDDDFLAGFDVDAAVQQAETAASPAAIENSPAAAKRLKRTPLQDNPASLFPPNSNIVVGTTTNPKQELATAASTNNIASTKTTTPSPSFSSLEDCLQHYFGFSKFRAGQHQVIDALVHHQKDAAVFWATGSGKSLCFQIPPLYLNKVAIVVSPLISLMQDQVRKLNGLLPNDANRLATYLGSGQMDPQEEQKALNGDYRLVYVTPEKLVSGNFLKSLAYLQQTKQALCLFAIDESHCVSEWGHDFRPEFRQLHVIRETPALRNVPMVALTATAVPRVQQDIVTSLGLQNPTIVRQTFDRPNLRINVTKKTSGGFRAAFTSDFLKKLQKSSTIFVCSDA